MVPFDRFTVVLDACTLFPMLPRDVLLTLATHGFFSPKWSPRIRAEWTRNLSTRMTQLSTDGDAQIRVDRIQAREAEDRHAAGYARAPVSPGEFDIWLDEQDWGSP